jgi:PAS domain S-box-containing protein
MVRDIFYVREARRDAPYPLSVDVWMELSSQAKESFSALRDDSLRIIRMHVETLEIKAEHAIALHMTLMLLSLGLCLYSFRVITHRVIRPINAMVAALVDAAEGKPIAAFPVNAGAQDEIGKLARVLHAFQEAGERYRALIEASTQITWTWEPGETGQLDAFKDWWQETTGQPRDDILPYGWLDYVHPEDRDRAHETWATASSEGRSFEIEYRVRSLSGRYRWAFYRAVAIRNADGSVREFVGSLNDITERREAEAALLSYTHALECSNRELDDFAYIASHDLKEPLRGLFNHATFLLEDYKDKLDEDGVRKLHRLSYLSQRMERLVNDLLYFSRLGRQDLAVQLTNMNEVIYDIQKTLEIFLEERHARIRVVNKLPSMTCDKPRITEVFRNLITNAVKYNEKDEKIVEIGFLETYPLGGDIMRNVFYVKDNGRGIAAQFYEEIFRIFKRLQSTKGEGEEGTGVGLTFVKKIIERHEGKIWLESEVGVGTTFYFTLSA